MIAGAISLAVVACGSPSSHWRASRRPPHPERPSAVRTVIPSDLMAPRIIGWLHARGQRILDSRGRRVRFRGMNVSGLGPGDGDPDALERTQTGCPGWAPPPRTELDDIASWGFNIIRLPISWANLEPARPTTLPSGTLRHHWNRPYLQAIDSTVQAFEARGIAVILEMAQANWSPVFAHLKTHFGTMCRGVGMPVWLYPHQGSGGQAAPRRSFYANQGQIQQGYAEAWKLVASRYAAVPTVVGLDTVNEPNLSGMPPRSLHLDALYQRVMSAIRAANRRTLLIFQDTPDIGGNRFGLSRPPPFAGVVYSFHLYVTNWAPDGRRETEDFVRRARSWNVPLWIGEFDVFDQASPWAVDPRWTSDLQVMLDYCRSHWIGWSIFTYGIHWFLDPFTREPLPGLLPMLQGDF